jgi:hypothetical protein
MLEHFVAKAESVVLHPFSHNDSTNKILTEQKDNHASAPDKAKLAIATEKEVALGVLPPLALFADALDQTKTGHAINEHVGQFLFGAKEVSKDLAKGAEHELSTKEGWQHIGEAAAIGAAAGIATVALAPELVTGLAIAGIAYGGYELYKNASGYMHDVKVDARPGDFSAAEQQKAHKDLQTIGARGVDMAAGMAGGAIGNFAAKEAIASLGTSSASEISTTGVGAKSEAAPVNEAVAKPGSVSEVAPKPEPTPEQVAISDSVKTNQQIFSAAGEDDGVLTTKKQLYNVKFRQVTDEGGVRLQTLENRGEGELVKQGEWIATRLNTDGSPVIEDGMTNQWGVNEKTILKTYNVTPGELQGSTEFVAPTKIDGPPVHMVQLNGDLEIKTPWGSMSGHQGDYLANYNFDPATGTAGDNYAIVTNKSFQQTYEITH